MQHTEVDSDGQNSFIMMQIENRNWHAGKYAIIPKEATKLFQSPGFRNNVELLLLKKQKNFILHMLREIGHKMGIKPRAWQDVFGTDVYTDENIYGFSLCNMWINWRKQHVPFYSLIC